MQIKIKTANTPKHNYSRGFNRYLRTRSTRSLAAIYRTKRLDAGFFFLDFYPLLRDNFLLTHQQFSERDFEVLMQLHANQPFSTDDLYACTVKKQPDFYGDWTKRTSLGDRLVDKYVARFLKEKVCKVYKKNGRYNKKLYVLSDEMNSIFRRFYENMLCLSKIQSNNHAHVNPQTKKSKTHYKKILKQNLYKDSFDKEIKAQIETDDRTFSVQLAKARAESRSL